MEAEWVQAIAELVTALIAGAAVVAARREIQSWRTQRREEKKAEVAGLALVAASELWTGIRTATSEEGWDEVDSESVYIDHLFDVLSFVRLEAFRSARVQVETFLSPEANDALERLYVLRDEIWALLEVAQSLCDKYGLIKAGARADAVFERLQGSAMRKRLDNCVEQVKHVLRAYVLYDVRDTY